MKQPGRENIRVLIVDDSLLIRNILAAMLSDAPGLQVVGQACDGEEAVRMAARLRPDVITMDIRMPGLNGMEATRQIMSTTPTPIVVLASSIYEADLNIAFNAVAAGALTVVEKPKGLSAEEFGSVRDQLVTTLRLMSEVQVVTFLPAADKTQAAPSMRVPDPHSAPPHIEIVAIAASTGGPGILRQILDKLPADFSIPILIVQHITPGFGQGFANWMAESRKQKVKLAWDGAKAAPGHTFIAPEKVHMTITPGNVIRLDHSDPINGSRPSATRLFESVAKTYGPAGLGIILSGMGEDGVSGLETLRQAGGWVIAQEMKSCVVFGMPRVAIERGVVDEILTPDEIAQALTHLNGRRPSPPSSADRQSVIIYPGSAMKR